MCAIRAVHTNISQPYHGALDTLCTTMNCVLRCAVFTLLTRSSRPHFITLYKHSRSQNLQSDTCSADWSAVCSLKCSLKCSFQWVMWSVQFTMCSGAYYCGNWSRQCPLRMNACHLLISWSDRLHCRSFWILANIW